MTARIPERYWNCTPVFEVAYYYLPYVVYRPFLGFAVIPLRNKINNHAAVIFRVLLPNGLRILSIFYTGVKINIPSEKKLLTPQEVILHLNVIYGF